MQKLNPELANAILAEHTWCLEGQKGGIFSTGKNIIALLDLLYNEGCEGVSIFLNALKKLHDINPTLYIAFKEVFVDGNLTIMFLMNEKNLAIISELGELRGPALEWWIKLTLQHGELIIYPDLSQLYNGFKYFLQQLAKSETKQELSDNLTLQKLADRVTLPTCPIQNSRHMLVTLYRLLAILSKVQGRNLSNQMNHLAGLDLTQDGAWYAARWERFHFFHQEMHLSSTKIDEKFEIEVLGREVSTYKVDYEQLLNVAEAKLNVKEHQYYYLLSKGSDDHDSIYVFLGLEVTEGGGRRERSQFPLILKNGDEIGIYEREGGSLKYTKLDAAKFVNVQFPMAENPSNEVSTETLGKVVCDEIDAKRALRYP